MLPGLDDGPVDLELALQLVLGLEAIGFTDIYPTPHQKDGAWAPTTAERTAAAQELSDGLHQVESVVTIHPPGGENMWDDLFLNRLEDRSYPTYPAGKSFLLELRPDILPPKIDEQLFRFRIEGSLPVLAHVERYPTLVKDQQRLRAIGRSAALLVNLPTLGGGSGFWSRRTARRLVQQGLVHAVATDTHQVEDLTYCRLGLEWLRRRELVQRMLWDNPLKILAGELPDL